MAGGALRDQRVEDAHVEGGDRDRRRRRSHDRAGVGRGAEVGAPVHHARETVAAGVEEQRGAASAQVQCPRHTSDVIVCRRLSVEGKAPRRIRLARVART
jgi:hypothetical protein